MPRVKIIRLSDHAYSAPPSGLWMYQMGDLSPVGKPRWCIVNSRGDTAMVSGDWGLAAKVLRHMGNQVVK